MEHGGKNITEIKFYECGYCVNQLSHVFRRHHKEKRNFPALVVLIKHREYGNMLFDTGYSELIYQNGFPSFLYNAINNSPQRMVVDEQVLSEEHLYLTAETGKHPGRNNRPGSIRLCRKH